MTGVGHVNSHPSPGRARAWRKALHWWPHPSHGAHRTDALELGRQPSENVTHAAPQRDKVLSSAQLPDRGAELVAEKWVKGQIVRVVGYRPHWASARTKDERPEECWLHEPACSSLVTLYLSKKVAG